MLGCCGWGGLALEVHAAEDLCRRCSCKIRRRRCCGAAAAAPAAAAALLPLLLLHFTTAACPRLPTARSAFQMRREIREAELAAARDNEPNPEELEKYIKERFGNRRCVVPSFHCPTRCRPHSLLPLRRLFLSLPAASSLIRNPCFNQCSYASYGYDEEGGDGRPRAVGQQALMPTATDPKVTSWLQSSKWRCM